MVLIDQLPSEVIIKIFSYLHFKDLVSCSYVSVRFNEASQSNELWKSQCQNVWHTSSCEKETDWRDIFVTYYKKFGSCFKHYAPIKKAWDQILTYMDCNCKDIHDSVNDGASVAHIEEAERIIGHPLPPDYRCSLLLHNGQSHLNNYQFPGLMGSMSIHNHYRSESLLDITYISSKNLPCSDGCIPITLCSVSGIAQHMALTNDHPGLEIGTIFYPADVVRRTTRINAFISAKSFTEWLITFAEQLCRGDFTLKDGEIYRFLTSCDSALKTDAISVNAKTCFMPEFSSIQNSNFFHTYEITMTMDVDAPSHRSCQLETRHWIVTNDDGCEECVNGPGVVGEFPIMKPGSTFSWVSCSNFRTTYGHMKGHFTMRNLSTGDKIDVMCPTFHMKSMPYVSSSRNTF